MDAEDQGTSGHDPDDDWGDEVDNDRLRGWIPPDDRLWRHPSESVTRQPGALPSIPAPNRAGPRDRTGPWIVGGATACLVLALVAAGLVVATTNRPDGSSTGPSPKLASLTDVPTTEPGVGRVASAAAIASMMTAVLPSTVALIIDSDVGTSYGTGLVVESGGIIVTTSRAVPSSRSVTAVEANGTRVSASKLGTDPVSGLSVLRIDDDLIPATFDFGGPASGTVAVAMALQPDPPADRSPTPVIYAGKVIAAGVALGFDRVSSTFAAFAVEAPLSATDIGCPLLDSEGQVVGILERAGGKGWASASTFLPAELAWGVADQLVSSDSVDPGWTGIGAGNAMAPSAPPTPAGALVDSVATGSPAASDGIQTGDVVTAIDGYRVRSAAELATRLYPQQSGSEVTLTLDRAGATMTRQLELADASPAAPERAASP